MTTTKVYDLAIDPLTSNTLYAGTNGGVFKSMDGGASWNAINNGLTTTGVPAMAIDPATPSRIYAGTNGGGVFAMQQIVPIYLPMILRN